MTTIDKINELIDNTYTIEITSDTEVNLDDYTEGEGEFRNGWTNDKVIFHTESENLKSEVKQYLVDYIEDTLYVTCSEKDLLEAIGSYDDNEYFFVSKTVDNENTDPSETQIEDWKKGKEELFVQNIRITVSINGKELPADLLLEIMKD